MAKNIVAYLACYCVCYWRTGIHVGCYRHAYIWPKYRLLALYWFRRWFWPWLCRHTNDPLRSTYRHHSPTWRRAWFWFRRRVYGYLDRHRTNWLGCGALFSGLVAAIWWLYFWYPSAK